MKLGRFAESALAALVPSTALAQAVANGPTGTPLLWMWVGIAVVLLAIVLVLLFAGSGQRGRAHSREHARREVRGGA